MKSKFLRVSTRFRRYYGIRKTIKFFGRLPGEAGLTLNADKTKMLTLSRGEGNVFDVAREDRRIEGFDRIIYQGCVFSVEGDSNTVRQKTEKE